MKYAIQQRKMDGTPLKSTSIAATKNRPYIEISMLDNNERYIDGGIISVGVYIGSQKIRERTLNEKEMISIAFGIDYDKYSASLDRKGGSDNE